MFPFPSLPMLVLGAIARLFIPFAMVAQQSRAVDDPTDQFDDDWLDRI